MTIAINTRPPPAILEPIRFARSDNEFLPAALEILETPLSPLRFTGVLSICGFVVVALAWSFVGRIDIVAVAQGKIQPVGRTKIVEPLETGKVHKLLVENGRRVRAGDVLLNLDAGDAQADEAVLGASLQSLRAEARRRKLALDAAATRALELPKPIAWPVGTSQTVTDREERVLAGDLTQLRSTVAGLTSQQRQKIAERDRLTSTIEAQQLLVATLKQRVDMRQILLNRASGTKASLIDAEETWQYHGATLAAERGQIREVDAAFQSVQADIERAYANFVADNAQKLAAAERDIEDVEHKLGKAKLRTAYMTLTSPIDGVVQGVTVTTAGQVVTTGEQIMQVVPEDGRIEIEAYLPNADVGFAKIGQQAIVKVESFPFTTYGTVNAHVVRIGRDAIPLNDASQRESNPTQAGREVTFGGAQRLQNLVYPITLALDQQSIGVDGADVPLGPGMAVVVEIKTGTRRILDYLTSPLVQIGSTAIKER